MLDQDVIPSAHFRFRFRVTVVAQKCSSQSGMRNADVLVVRRERLRINLECFLKKLLRLAIFLSIHQHTGKIGKSDSYVVVLSFID